MKRHTPFVANYRPQFYIRTTDVTGVISLPKGTEIICRVINSITVNASIAMENNLKFAIREG